MIFHSGWLYEVVDISSQMAANNKSIALEWLENTLALHLLGSLDFKPANILLYEIEIIEVTAKLGDWYSGRDCF